jgi:membrane-bound serine protease (ClpP class)
VAEAAMGKLAVIIAIFLCGLLAMAIELVTPGVVLGIIGFLAVIGTIVYAFVIGYTVTAVVLLVVTLAFVPVFFLAWKHIAGRVMALRADESGFRPSTTLSQDLVGLEGEAASPLRPSGIVYLDGKRCDVVTRGEMLEKGARIKVIEVSGNRIVVKKV